MSRLTVLRDVSPGQDGEGKGEVLSFPELRAQIVAGKILRHLFSYGEVKGLTYRLETMSKPFNTFF